MTLYAGGSCPCTCATPSSCFGSGKPAAGALSIRCTCCNSIASEGRNKKPQETRTGTGMSEGRAVQLLFQCPGKLSWFPSHTVQFIFLALRKSVTQEENKPGWLSITLHILWSWEFFFLLLPLLILGNFLRPGPLFLSLLLRDATMQASNGVTVQLPCWSSRDRTTLLYIPSYAFLRSPCLAFYLPCILCYPTVCCESAGPCRQAHTRWQACLALGGKGREEKRRECGSRRKRETFLECCILQYGVLVSFMLYLSHLLHFNVAWRDGRVMLPV